MTETRTISASALEREKREGHTVELIDVRTPVEFRELHAERARNVPLDTLEPNEILQGRNGESNEPLYLICRTGSRAKQAAAKCEKAGVGNVFVVEGGTEAWGGRRATRGSWQEGGFARTSGSNRCGVSGVSRFAAYVLRQSVLRCAARFRRRWPCLCRHH